MPAGLSSQNSQSARMGAVARVAFLLAIAAAAIALVIVNIRGANLGTVPIDGCYYLSKAKSLAETGRLRVPWGTGVDTKFFPGLSIFFAIPLKLLGMTWGWLLVESICFAGGAWLTSALARRLGLGAAGASIAAIFFVIDPLIIKWASVPYAEVPALFFTLASIEFAFRARDAANRRAGELLAALALGVAGTMRIEAFFAAPAFLFIVSSRRSVFAKIAAATSTAFVIFLPIAAHLAVMNSIGVGPSRLHYVEEFFNNFSWEKYAASLSAFAQESIYLIPKSKESLASGMAAPLAAAFAVARALAAGAAIGGAILLIAGSKRAAATVAIASFIIFAFVHALWHYADARFLVMVWPVHCIAAAAAFEWLIIKLQSAAAAASVFGAATFVALAFLLASNHIADAHAAEWERTTGGSARELAERIDRVVSPTAEGYYEFEDKFMPRVATGPFVAMFRAAPAHICFQIPNFPAPDVAPEAVPELLKSGDRFAMTNLTFDEWIRRYVTNPADRAGFKALLEERGHTLVVWRS
ncbi:MAG: hypothetical protein HY286_10875 [Planctomycetes bacterium]|nr:hypothetical protein [Planctomycetota bacterium]